MDTDRLAEEKRRGITIELGFARYAPAKGCSFGIVDVPGHEGFVRTMVAGATGMDIVLLVVAADEGVMPQTREHLAIVKLLGVEGLVVAVTKADLVDDEWLELVTEEVQEVLEDTNYRNAEIIPTSVRTGAGLRELSDALVRSRGAFPGAFRRRPRTPARGPGLRHGGRGNGRDGYALVGECDARFQRANPAPVTTRRASVPFRCTESRLSARPPAKGPHSLSRGRRYGAAWWPAATSW